MISIKSLSFPYLHQVAFISPHPDDVELCCGVLVRRLISSGVKVYYFCVTDGAPSPEVLSTTKRLSVLDNYDQLTYKAIRREETIKALSILGVNLTQVKFFDWPDLECYKHIPEIIQDFYNILKNADGIFCCPFEGGHPDHDITRFALAVASTHYSGYIFEYASYNNRGYQIFQRDSPCYFTLKIEPQEQKIKQQIAKIFVSQREEIKQFKTNIECLRQTDVGLTLNEYTTYDITPYYEQFAYSSSSVLEKIKEYLSLIGNRGTAEEK